MFKHDCHATTLGDPGDGGRDQGHHSAREHAARDGQGGRASPIREGRRPSPLDDGSVLVKRGQCDVLTCTDQVLLQSLFVTSKSALMALLDVGETMNPSFTSTTAVR